MKIKECYQLWLNTNNQIGQDKALENQNVLNTQWPAKNIMIQRYIEYARYEIELWATIMSIKRYNSYDVLTNELIQSTTVLSHRLFYKVHVLDNYYN